MSHMPDDPDTRSNPLRSLWDRITTTEESALPESGRADRGRLVREGALVRLRAHVPANRGPFQRWYADEDIARLLRHDLRPLTPVQSIVYFDSVVLPGSARGLMFAIHERESDELIGTCGLTDLDLESRGGCFFRIVIGEPRYWGRGFGTDATHLALAEAFESHGRTHVNLEVFDYNLRAIRSYEKVGFVKTGEHVEWPSAAEPDLHVLEMRIDRDQFNAREPDKEDSSARIPEPDAGKPA
jgi:RimJ/RimL family protein N-acetyltransferase